MPFSQLNYNERRTEKEALECLLDEYFASRRNCATNTNGAKQPMSVSSAKAPVQKPKPSVPAPRTSPIPVQISTPLPRGPPPPINRGTRPSNTKVPLPVPSASPPLETPPIWAGSVTKFEYPAPDHDSPGINLFNRYLPYPINELHSATITIFELLYSTEIRPKSVHSPVKLIMRDMGGVAHAANSMSYTGQLRGQAFPNVTHRSDFVFSTQYLAGLEHHSDPAFEIRGIILHELTHTFQYSAKNTPGGLIEGIADFVRLRGGHAAKHWTESPQGKKWDQGYETTAYFLDWSDKNIYEGLVMQINDWLGKNETYDEGQLFAAVMPGWSWEVLWDQYIASR